MTFDAPHVDYAGLSPVITLTAGICVVLLAGLIRPSRARWVVPALTVLTLGVAAGLCAWQWGERTDLVSGALRLDQLALAGALIAIGAAAVCSLLMIREPAAEEAGHGELCALLLGSTLGMVLLAQAQNLISLFIALELLSVPLYVMCGSARFRERSLESGLKYLIIGSLGSATLLYGLALIYGGSGSTDFTAIAAGIRDGGLASDPLILVGVALVVTGLAFKISIAPFHQWTPDVYEGAPTPVTAFMAVATKAAAFCVLVRLLDVALGPVSADWDGPLAILAAVSIAVGNVGALGQDSLKRLMGYSGIAQAGYMLGGVVVATEIGLNALVFYLAAYTLMNLAAFGAIVARERETPFGDDIRGFAGLGRERPQLAWPLTIGMLALAGLPGTAGFIGKLYLIEALADDGYTWLGVAIVVGTMISLAYYLRVVAAVWMRPAEEAPAAAEPLPAAAGGAPDADTLAAHDPARGTLQAKGAGRCGFVVGSAVITAAATVFFGVIPSPLVDWASEAGASIAPFL
jgi:NADH-quinone oxidoreductase subunit N